MVLAVACPACMDLPQVAVVHHAHSPAQRRVVRAARQHLTHARLPAGRVTRPRVYRLVVVSRRRGNKEVCNSLSLCTELIFSRKVNTHAMHECGITLYI